MSLQQWADNGWLRAHQSSAQEIAGLLAIVARDLGDAEGDISPGWRFGIAYNAALKLCTILLHASGYRPEKTLQHYRAIAALPEILGKHWQEEADYLETCRRLWRTPTSQATNATCTRARSSPRRERWLNFA
jgi:hypothetical protein